MPQGAWKTIPQVLSIVAVGRDGQMRIIKAVREHLDYPGGQLRLVDGDELLLTAAAGAGGASPEMTRTGVRLPECALRRLGAQTGSHLAIVARQNAVAVKMVTVEERVGPPAELVDVETPFTLTRLVRAPPMPAQLLPQLRDEYRGCRLGGSIASFLAGRATLEAWKARGLLGVSDSDDAALRDALIEERVGSQATDGSWQGQVTRTARSLRELHDLDLAREDGPVARGAEWLLEQPESEHNPGMFFLSR
jgi:hypothetical protein